MSDSKSPVVWALDVSDGAKYSIEPFCVEVR
jgi:hypothetical protein